jgi:hypothetical protein
MGCNTRSRKEKQKGAISEKQQKGAVSLFAFGFINYAVRICPSFILLS